MKQRWARILLYAVRVGWCLLFLRCETTEKSMIRVVYLEQKEQTWSVGLLYQSPEAAADAADASAALRIAGGRGQTLETALAAAEGTLPHVKKQRNCPTNCWTNSKRARRQCPGCMHTRKACCFLCFACPKHRKGK